MIYSLGSWKSWHHIGARKETMSPRPPPVPYVPTRKRGQKRRGIDRKSERKEEKRKNRVGREGEMYQGSVYSPISIPGPDRKINDSIG